MEETELDTVIRIDGEGLSIQYVCHDERRDLTYNFALWASTEVHAVVSASCLEALGINRTVCLLRKFLSAIFLVLHLCSQMLFLTTAVLIHRICRRTY